MFTLDQIKAAHSKVTSGAHFPAYIQDLKKLGVIYYEVFVADGHTNFYGANNHKITSPAKYEALQIAKTVNHEQFKLDLKVHQQGKTNYLTFCNNSAKSGVEKWVVIMQQNSCTYFDTLGNNILVEHIPEVN